MSEDIKAIIAIKKVSQYKYAYTGGAEGLDRILALDGDTGLEGYCEDSVLIFSEYDITGVDDGEF